VAAEYDAEHSGSTTDEPRRPDGSGTSTDAPETTRR